MDSSMVSPREFIYPYYYHQRGMVPPIRAGRRRAYRRPPIRLFKEKQVAIVTCSVMMILFLVTGLFAIRNHLTENKAEFDADHKAKADLMFHSAQVTFIFYYGVMLHIFGIRAVIQQHCTTAAIFMVLLLLHNWLLIGQLKCTILGSGCTKEMFVLPYSPYFVASFWTILGMIALQTVLLAFFVCDLNEKNHCREQQEDGYEMVEV